MDSSLKQRLVGAVVLVALAVIFLPMLVKGPAPDSGVSDVSLAIPAEPGGGDVRTVDLPLVVPEPGPGGSATGMPAPVQGVVAPAAGAGEGLFPATAGGDFAVSFGSYATALDADKVIGALRSAELPAYRELATVAGRAAHRVRIGPFADRAMAESARLRAVHVRDDLDARVIALDAGNPAAPPAASTAVPAPAAPAAKPVALPPPPKPVAVAPSPPPAPPSPAAPAPAPSAPPVPAPAPAADTSGTGFVVQVGAFADAAAATALRDRLRGAGFNAFTDAVDTEAGRRTRVRVGPTVSRAEADALKAQVKARAGVDGIVRQHP